MFTLRDLMEDGVTTQLTTNDGEYLRRLTTAVEVASADELVGVDEFAEYIRQSSEYPSYEF